MNDQTHTPHHALWAILIDDLIDRRMAVEVESARKLMEAYLKNKPDMQRKQLSNLEAVAAETNTVAVVEDWVRYQMGRDDRGRNWHAGTPPLGDEVLQHLKELEGVARSIVRDAKSRGITAPSDDASEAARVWMVLTRRFAALLEHSFLFYSKGKAKGGRPA